MDNALRALIEREASAGTEVEVVFDAPTKDWAGRRNVPTVDVYLYDIREDLRRRERGLINEYDDGDRISGRHLPPRYFKLSYLVTAWTQRPEDEHRLLAALLSCFLRHDALPTELLTGPLAELGLPVPVTIALPPPEDRSFADVWSALGGELKPSLDIVVSAPTDTGQRYPAAPPVTEPSRDLARRRSAVAAREAGGGTATRPAGGTAGGARPVGPGGRSGHPAAARPAGDGGGDGARRGPAASPGRGAGGSTSGGSGPATTGRSARGAGHVLAGAGRQRPAAQPVRRSTRRQPTAADATGRSTDGTPSRNRGAGDAGGVSQQ